MVASYLGARVTDLLSDLTSPFNGRITDAETAGGLFIYRIIALHISLVHDQNKKDIMVLPEVAGEALLSFSVRLEASCAKN